MRRRGDFQLAIARRRRPLADVDARLAFPPLHGQAVLEPFLLGGREGCAGREVLGIHILIIEDDEGVAKSLG